MNAAPHLPALLAAGETRLSAEQIYPRCSTPFSNSACPPAACCPSRRWARRLGSAVP